MANRPLPAYEGDEPFVFVSFSHADESLVYPEIRWLQDQGIHIWYDEGISGGSRWRDAIAGHLSGCHLLLFFVTPRSVASQVCREELEFALDEERPILSVHLEPTELPDGVRMAIANRQALFREELEPDDYERKLLSAVATYIDRPIGDAEGAVIRPRRKRRVTLRAAVAAALLVGLAAAGGVRLVDTVAEYGTGDTSNSGPGVVRFAIPVADDVVLQDCFGEAARYVKGHFPTTALAMSNDGRMIVYAGRDKSDKTQQLYLRRLDADRAVVIPETVGGYAPIFSKDDQWLYFFDGRQLRRVPVAGGAADVIWDWRSEAVCVPGGFGWLNADTLVINNVKGGFSLIDAAGGDPQMLVEPVPSDNYGGYWAPHGLPDDEHILFHRFPGNLDPEQAAIFAINASTGNQQLVLEDAMYPKYLARSGELLFMRRGALLAAPFDPAKMAIAGDPVVVQPGIMQAIGMFNSRVETGSGQVAVSATGHLAFISGSLFPPELGTLVTVTREGTSTPVSGLTERNFGQVRRSPNGRYILFVNQSGWESSLFVHDTVRGVTRRLKTGGFHNTWTAWSPDGRFVAFTSDREEGKPGVYRMPADGSGEPENLVQPGPSMAVASWSVDGDIAFLKDGDIWILREDGEEQALFESPEFERFAAFSPDGRWIAYASEANVYVRAYPGPGPAILVADGAWSPHWSHDGRELYFFAAGTLLPDLMVVEHQNGTFSASRKLMTWPYKTYVPLTQYDTLPDGSFLTATMEDVDEAQYRTTEIRVVLNFDQLIDRASRR